MELTARRTVLPRRIVISLRGAQLMAAAISVILAIAI